MTYKTNKPSKAKWSGIIFSATFLAFPILQFIVFYLGVNVKSWISAFQPEFGEEFSFINFRKSADGFYSEERLSFDFTPIVGL